MAKVDTFYRAKRAATLVNPVAETTVKQADNSALATLTYLLASGKLSGQGCTLQVRGEIVSGAAQNVTITLRAGTTVAGALIATSGAVALAGAGNFNFELNFEGVWDSQSDTLRGRMFGHVGAVAVAEVVNSGAISGFDPDGAVDMPVCTCGLFSVSNAANEIRVKELLSGTA